jgi:hypothetical protein
VGTADRHIDGSPDGKPLLVGASLRLVGASLSLVGVPVPFRAPLCTDREPVRADE